MPDNKLTCTDEMIEAGRARLAECTNVLLATAEIKAIIEAAMAARPIPTGYEDIAALMEVLRHGDRNAVWQRGPEAADAITTLLTKLAEQRQAAADIMRDAVNSEVRAEQMREMLDEAFDLLGGVDDAAELRGKILGVPYPDREG